ncbi:MAG: amidohydrolase family protein [Synergistaceae bacterium]|nr:amidohydrolase family protein [Synergistaceae bacterium]
MKTFIKNGQLIDPKNKINSRLNLLLEDGRVADITRDDAANADIVIDATGLIVTPGFIDIHMHEDPLNDDGTLAVSITRSMLAMGVTTALGGNCGLNVADPVTYLDNIDRYGAPVNMALLAGQGWLREKVSKADKYSTISRDEIAKEAKEAKRALDGGCMGLSYGMRYVPGLTEEEYEATATLCCRTDRLVAAHVRDDAAGIFTAGEEFISVARRLDLNTEFSHIGSMAGFGQMEEFLRYIDETRARGMNLHCDCYPYYAFSTHIGSTTYDPGFLERYNTDYSVVEMCEGKYKGQRCTEEIYNYYRKYEPNAITVCHVMRQEDVDMALAHPGVMLGSDGLINKGQGHPRASGAFPRLIAEFVKKGVLSLYDAIAKMTSMPAEKLCLPNKGHLGRGAEADVTIFNLQTIKDNATFASPMTSPDGIEYVIIGGRLALKNGKIVNETLGRAVRK